MNIRKMITVAVLGIVTTGLAWAQEAQPDEPQTTVKEQTKKEKRQGRRKGAKGGAVLGLAMGAVAGDASLAVAGAAAGAVAGGVAGSWYDYDQSNQDNRTQMMADAIASNKTTDSSPPETVGEVGRRHFEELAGEWKVDVWYLGRDGHFKTATGSARGLAAGDNAIRVLFQNIVAETYDGTVTGQSLLNFQPGQGFFFECQFSTQDQPVTGIGEYMVDRNAYVFYLIEGEGGEMASGGVVRSNARMEVRIISPSLWMAETYTFIEGAEEKVQTYRLTRH